MVFLLCRGFNEAVNSLQDDGWSSIASDGVDDVTVSVNAYPTSRLSEGQFPLCDRMYTGGEGVLCAKTSLLLQVRNMNFASILHFLYACKHVQYLLLHTDRMHT